MVNSLELQQEVGCLLFHQFFLGINIISTSQDKIIRNLNSKEKKELI